jgi:hypothetical protein
MVTPRVTSSVTRSGAKWFLKGIARRLIGLISPIQARTCPDLSQPIFATSFSLVLAPNPTGAGGQCDLAVRHHALLVHAARRMRGRHRDILRRHRPFMRCSLSSPTQPRRQRNGGRGAMRPRPTCPSANCAVKERRRQVSHEAATASFSGEIEFR